jgi:hypothetical protein
MKIIRFVKSPPKLLCQQPAECGFTGTGNPENDLQPCYRITKSNAVGRAFAAIDNHDRTAVSHQDDDAQRTLQSSNLIKTKTLAAVEAASVLRIF